METGDLITRATAAAAFLFYVAAMAMWTRDCVNGMRTVWTLGCVALMVHVLCAFQFVHHWSHAEAFESTAQQTAALTGFSSGFGLYLNYALVLVWLADVCWWWLAGQRYESRSRVATLGVHGFLAFMWFNAAVVFGHGLARWLGIVATVVLVLLWRRRVT